MRRLLTVDVDLAASLDHDVGMRSLADPLAELHEHAAFFARAHELRLLDVVCSPELRSAALRQLSKLEFHADNSSPWVLLEDACLRADRGWQQRASQIVAQWSARRASYRDAGIEIGQVTRSTETSLLAFVDVVHQLVCGLCPPLTGLVVILAPTIVENDAFLFDELMTLLGEPRLAAVRWIFVHGADCSAQRLCDALGSFALACTCVLDPGAQRSDLLALMTAPTVSSKPWIAGPRDAEFPFPPRQSGRRPTPRFYARTASSRRCSTRGASSGANSSAPRSESATAT